MKKLILNFYMTITKKEFDKAVGKTFKGFYLPEKDEGYSLAGWYAVALDGVWEDVCNSKGSLTGYAVIGQHCAVAKDYLLECKKKTFNWVSKNYPKLIEDIYSIYRD